MDITLIHCPKCGSTEINKRYETTMTAAQNDYAPEVHRQWIDIFQRGEWNVVFMCTNSKCCHSWFPSDRIPSAQAAEKCPK